MKFNTYPQTIHCYQLQQWKLPDRINWPACP